MTIKPILGIVLAVVLTACAAENSPNGKPLDTTPPTTPAPISAPISTQEKSASVQSNYPIARVIKATNQSVNVQQTGASGGGVRIGAGASGGSGGGLFGGVGFSVDLGTLVGLFGGNKPQTITQVLWVYELEDQKTKQVYQSAPITKEMMLQSCVRYRTLANSNQVEVLSLEACS